MTDKNAELKRLRAELAEAKREMGQLQCELDALAVVELYRKETARAERAEAELADARELLREAIPHLVGNNYWDGVARIRAHLDLAEANAPSST